MQLILASGSPQRRALLAAAGYPFEIVIPDDSAECGICSTGGPAGQVAEMAVRKAQDVFRQLNEQPPRDVPRILIACDTLAECGGAVLGKPRDEEHASQMLMMLRGQVHRVYSGLCVWPCVAGSEQRCPQPRIAVTQLQMEKISDAHLDAYLASGLWRGKAGALGYQDRQGWLTIQQGSQSNVIGLPMELLAEMLAPWDEVLRPE
ncbi:MAG: Maf family protein [Pirellulales bacterium]|nr:Maf family protein [Pirellulales bacterium]